MANTAVKHSYTVPCSSAFRDAVENLAQARRVNAGDLARSILLMMPPEAVALWPDPGEPEAGDRETVVLKSGPSEGRPWRRKPRLQVRMPEGHDPVVIRKALALALSLSKGQVALSLTDPKADKKPASEPAIETPAKPAEPPDHIMEELERLRTIVGALAFDPLAHGVRTRAEALYVLGFPPGAMPDTATIRARFRMLAAIHHPDAHTGNHARMAQINAAVDILRRGLG